MTDWVDKAHSDIMTLLSVMYPQFQQFSMAESSAEPRVAAPRLSACKQLYASCHLLWQFVLGKTQPLSHPY